MVTKFDISFSNLTRIFYIAFYNCFFDLSEYVCFLFCVNDYFTTYTDIFKILIDY